MAVTKAAPGSGELLSEQIGKIVNSAVLRGSESLCRLLRFLADQSIERPGASVKEYRIATEVFGRTSDFDPRLDSTVRVQTSRLRSKLAEYYAGAGADDAIIVEIPKGSYSLAVHVRPAVHDVPRHAEGPGEAPVESGTQGRPVSNVAVWALSFLSAGLALALVYLTVSKQDKPVATQGGAPASLRVFWRDFIDSPAQPWVIFSNAEFVGRPETGMRYFNPAKDDRGAILDHYTGVGEVTAIHELDRLFAQLRHGVLVKRGRLLAMDDAKNNDLILVGSPSENLPLRDLPATQRFEFRTAERGPRKGDLAIFNAKPGAGENAAYFGSASIPISEDYALIARGPGLTSSHAVMILAGTTTIGTQAAVEYVCRPGNVEGLLKRAGAAPNAGMPPFEAVIRVKVSRGVPVSSELILFHLRGE